MAGRPVEALALLAIGVRSSVDVARRDRAGEGDDPFARSQRGDWFHERCAFTTRPTHARDVCVCSLPIMRSKFRRQELESLLPCHGASGKTYLRGDKQGASCRIRSIGVRWNAKPHRAVQLVACCAISAKRAASTSPRSRRACGSVAPYLEAIEEGRFDKLPGAAYIPAFLRAYAAHVGLDPEKVLTAYHLSGPVPIKRPVTLPADFPIVEKRAPIGLAVLTVLLVVGAGYAAWHYLPREQAVVAEKVPPVPDRLLASRPAPSPPTEARRARNQRSGTGGRRRRSPPRRHAGARHLPRRSLAGAPCSGAPPPPPQPQARRSRRRSSSPFPRRRRRR